MEHGSFNGCFLGDVLRQTLFPSSHSQIRHDVVAYLASSFDFSYSHSGENIDAHLHQYMVIPNHPISYSAGLSFHFLLLVRVFS